MLLQFRQHFNSMGIVFCLSGYYFLLPFDRLRVLSIMVTPWYYKTILWYVCIYWPGAPLWQGRRTDRQTGSGIGWRWKTGTSRRPGGRRTRPTGAGLPVLTLSRTSRSTSRWLATVASGRTPVRSWWSASVCVFGGRPAPRWRLPPVSTRCTRSRRLCWKTVANSKYNVLFD